MMLVPDILQFAQSSIGNLKTVFAEFSELKTGKLIEEFETKERRALDDAVLVALGSDPMEARALRDSIYAEVTQMFTVARSMELVAQKNRLKAARGGETGPETATNVQWEISDETEQMDD